MKIKDGGLEVDLSLTYVSKYDDDLSAHTLLNLVNIDAP